MNCLLGINSITVIPRKGERKVFPMQKGDTTMAHWQNFLKRVRTPRGALQRCRVRFARARRPEHGDAQPAA